MVFKKQTKFNAKMAKPNAKFQNCAIKNSSKDQIRDIADFKNFLGILNQKNSLITNDLRDFLDEMNFLPIILILLSNNIAQQSKIYPELFINIYKIFVYILKSKGGIPFLTKDKNNLKLFLQVFEFLQKKVNLDKLNNFQTDNLSSKFNSFT